MKTIPLSKGYCAQVSDKDYKRCLIAGPWFAFIHRKTVYGVRNIKKGQKGSTYLHRFILRVKNPAVLVDHKDGNGLHCWRRNIRKVNPSQSQMNRGKQTNNTSGVSGVSWHKRAKKFEAHIKVHRKKKYIGLFTNLKTAKKAVEKAKKTYYGIFRRTR